MAYHDTAAGRRAGRAALASLDYAGLCAAAGYRVPLAGDVMALLASHGLAGHLDLKETGYEAEVIGAGARGVRRPGKLCRRRHWKMRRWRRLRQRFPR